MNRLTAAIHAAIGDIDPDATRQEHAQALAEAVAGCGGWQPIETAPKDGTEFDIWCIHHKGYTNAPKRIANCRYVDDVLEYKHSHGWFPLNSYSDSHVTWSHWMPPPEPPRSIGYGEGE